MLGINVYPSKQTGFMMIYEISAFRSTRLVEQHTSKVPRGSPKTWGAFSAASLGWLVLSTCFNMFQISFTTVIILVIYDD